MHDAFGLRDAFDKQSLSEVKSHTKQFILQKLSAGDELVCLMHPLGFLMSKLAETSSGETLRLHIWSPEYRVRQEPYWPIHDHIFSYQSCVLIGRLRHIEYTVRPTDRDRIVYTVQYVGQRSNLLRTQSGVRVVDSNVENHPAGTLYSMNAGIFHETIVADHETTVTAMLATPPSSSAPRVLGDLDGGPSYSYDRRGVAIPLTDILASF